MAKVLWEPDSTEETKLRKSDIKYIINRLNSLLEVDREAVSKLLLTDIDCNQTMIDKVGVEKDTVTGLGLLNTILPRTKNGWGAIVVDCNDEGTVINSFLMGKDYE